MSGRIAIDITSGYWPPAVMTPGSKREFFGSIDPKTDPGSTVSIGDVWYVAASASPPPPSGGYGVGPYGVAPYGV